MVQLVYKFKWISWQSFGRFSLTSTINKYSALFPLNCMIWSDLCCVLWGLSMPKLSMFLIVKKRKTKLVCNWKHFLNEWIHPCVEVILDTLCKDFDWKIIQDYILNISLHDKLIKFGCSFTTAWALLQICIKYLVLTSETIPHI